MTRKEERETARSYEFFRDLCQALKMRHQHLAVNPADEKEMDELRARVKEDPIWSYGEPPIIIPIAGVPKGEVRVVSQDQVMMMREAFNSRRGLGRFDKLYVPSHARKKMD